MTKSSSTDDVNTGIRTRKTRHIFLSGAKSDNGILADGRMKEGHEMFRIKGS